MSNEDSIVSLFASDARAKPRWLLVTSQHMQTVVWNGCIHIERTFEHRSTSIGAKSQSVNLVRTRRRPPASKSRPSRMPEAERVTIMPSHLVNNILSDIRHFSEACRNSNVGTSSSGEIFLKHSGRRRNTTPHPMGSAERVMMQILEIFQPCVFDHTICLKYNPISCSINPLRTMELYQLAHDCWLQRRKTKGGLIFKEGTYAPIEIISTAPDSSGPIRWTPRL